MLAPNGQTFIPDEQDDAAAGGSGDAQDGKSDTIVPQMASMLPSNGPASQTIQACVAHFIEGDNQ